MTLAVSGILGKLISLVRLDLSVDPAKVLQGLETVCYNEESGTKSK